MAGLLCPCGYGMNNIECPNDIEIHIFSDRKIDEYLERTVSEMWDDEGRYRYWRCPECGRVSVINTEKNRVCRVYSIESDYPEFK